MGTTADNREILYCKAPPPGAPIPLPQGLQQAVQDDAPDEDEVIHNVKRLKSHKAPGPSGLKAEDLKRWVHLHEKEDGN